MSFQKSLLTATLFAAASLTTISANAAPAAATGSFEVKLTVEKSCVVGAKVGTNDINFGTVSAATTALTKDANAAITVACSKTTPYKVALSPTGGSTTGTGNLIATGGDNTDKIAYALYSNPAATTAWGNVDGTNTVNGIGAGFGGGTATFTHLVTAKVLTTDVRPDTYKDTVNVNVIY